jgi:C_GCAxxG_C_C family probable redox protein
VAALQDSIEFVPKDKEIFRAGSGLSGGMSPSGDGNCGAFIGVAMILSSLCGRERNEFEDRGKTRRSKDLVREVYEKFKDEWGSSLCKDVRSNMAEYEDGCLIIVGKASAWTAEIILREFASD